MREVELHCQPFNIITLAQHKSDNNSRMIQLANVFVYCLGTVEPAMCDYNKRLITLSMIQLNGGHCILDKDKQLHLMCFFQIKMNHFFQNFNPDFSSFIEFASNKHLHPIFVV